MPKGEKRTEAWGWWFYAESWAEIHLDEEALRPYFKLENVRQGAFVWQENYGLAVQFV